MKNTVSKGFLYYLMVLVSIVLGVVCVFGAVLLLSPGKEVFGLRYIFNKMETQYLYEDIYQDPKHPDGTSDTFESLIAQGKINEIKFVTDFVDLDVRNEKVAEMRIIVKANISGIAKKDNREKFDIKGEFDEPNHLYTFTCLGPQCNFLCFSEDAKITFALPLDDPNTHNLKITFETETGNFEIGKKTRDDYTIKNLEITSKKHSDIYVGNKTRITEGIKLTTQKGNITFDTKLPLAENETSINVNRMDIKTKESKINMSNVGVNNFYLDSESSSVKINRIAGNMECSSRKGFIKINEILGNFTCEDDVIIANIQIGTCKGEVILPKADSSDITINKLESNCKIITKTGDVKINEIHGYAFIETETGSIKVTQFSDSENLVITPGKPTLSIKTRKGNIEANFKNVFGDNEIISTEKSDIKISFSKNCNHTIKLKYEDKNNPTFTTGIHTGSLGAKDELGYYNIQYGNIENLNNLTVIYKNGKSAFDDLL